MNQAQHPAASDLSSVKLLVLVGPTAVGKTKLSLELAEMYDAEIISGDSMQVYRGMDIGTAKATPEERRRVPHHLIDIRQPDEPFSVFFADLKPGAWEPVFLGHRFYDDGDNPIPPVCNHFLVQ